PSGVAILQDLKRFANLGSVLMVAAHPDDENTQLITYLARGRGYRTAYLSVTRGDGGQNVLGPEFGEELGVIRTQELLSARRLDGGRQFFTRAIDFGFSKDFQETLGIWDRKQVLGDVVRVIRIFRPDVIVTRFSPKPGNTHGHHTASAVLALDAFKIAGDPKAYPEQLVGDMKPWQPKRIFMNGGGPRGNDAAGANPSAIRIDDGGTDPVLGESFGGIARRSRAMHKTQGFGNFAIGAGGGGPHQEAFVLLDGEPATADILDGVDTTWNRVPSGGAAIATAVDAAIKSFSVDNPAASAPALLDIRGKLAGGAADDIVVNEKRRQLDRIIADCIGLSVQTTVPRAEYVPGETLELHHTVTMKSPTTAVRWVAVHYPKTSGGVATMVDLHANDPAARDLTQTLPSGTPLSQPYWLREEGTAGMFRVDDPALIGRPENPPAFPVEFVFDIGGQTLIIPDEPVAISSDAKRGELRRRLDVIPPVSLSFASQVRLFTPGASRSVDVEAIAYRA
ncbi:MAG TPA: PIG-L family deacetylase, partial [Tepidisphaeraceae bacterium]|nr:PIG-L family deacetylase [Tepidisphaeraceae bacterium]